MWVWCLVQGVPQQCSEGVLAPPLRLEGLRRPLRGPREKKSTRKVPASQYLPGTPIVEMCPFIQHNTPIFTFPHLYTEWSIMLCKRGHMDRWFHHPLLKGVNAENICWGNQYAPPSSLCNITPFDWHSTLKGRWKKQLKHNQWWTDDVWKRFGGSINTLVLWLFT